MSEPFLPDVLYSVKGNDRWRVCEHPERPFDPNLAGFCNAPCRACTIVAEMLLNDLDPLLQPESCEAVGAILDVVAPESRQW